MFSGEICTQQAANILIAVKYIWCNMLREMYSLNQLSMNTHPHGQNASLHTDTLTKRGLGHRDKKKSHAGKEAASSRREGHLGPATVRSPKRMSRLHSTFSAPLYALSLSPWVHLQSRCNAIYNIYCTTVTRLYNLKQEAFIQPRQQE